MGQKNEPLCLCVTFFWVFIFVKHIKANVSSYNHDYGKADRNKIRQRIKTRAIFDIFFLKTCWWLHWTSLIALVSSQLWLYLVLCVWTWVNRIMALRLAFLVCCALTGAGVKLLEAPVGATIVLITSNALVVLVMLLVFFWKETPSAVESPESRLHWNPEIPRRGMGDLIQSVSHIAIIVSDVGRSLAFYTEIIGFQQIQRPSFDRPGAWSPWAMWNCTWSKEFPMLHQVVIWSSLTLLWTPMSHTRSWRSCWNTRCRCKTFDLILRRERTWWKLLRTVTGRSLCVIPMATTWSFATATSSRPFASSRRMPRSRSQKPGYVPKYKKFMDAMLSTYNESGQVKASHFAFPSSWRTQLCLSPSSSISDV